MRKEYVGYIRVAHEDEMAVETQRNYIEHYAKQKNIKIDYYYIDNGFSGTNLERPQLKQMLREVRSKNIKKGIIVRDLSRISRDELLTQKVLNKITKRPVQLISTIEEENKKILFSRLFIDMYREFELERKIKSQKFFDERAVLITSPYKRGTQADFEYKKQKRDEFKEKGIHNIRFRYIEDNKKKVGTRDERN